MFEDATESRLRGIPVRRLEAAGVDVRPAPIDMEPAFNEASILVVPSSWMRAWGIVATEAQLRGIPDVASKVDGLSEAKRYVSPLLEVKAMNGDARDGNGTYIILEQDVTPWMTRLDEIMSSKERYVAVVTASFHTTREWCRELDERFMERSLLATKSTFATNPKAALTSTELHNTCS